LPEVGDDVLVVVEADRDQPDMVYPPFCTQSLASRSE
jgi:hypothetical protein